jgi:hypothetical protein
MTIDSIGAFAGILSGDPDPIPHTDLDPVDTTS